MNNNIVNLNLNSSKNSFNIKSSVAKDIYITPSLLDLVDHNNNNIKKIDENLLNAELSEEEYSFEELMKYAQEHSEEIDRKKKEEANRKAEEARIKAEKERQAYIESKKQELEELYKAREDNNGLFHPNIEAEIEAKILALEKELGVAHKPDGWESFCDGVKDVGATAVTFVGSAVEGFIDLGEGVVDGLIYGTAKTLQVVSFGSIDDKWAEDIIAYDFSAEMYDKVVCDWIGIDEEIAYGKAHSAGNFVGEMVGYYALSSVPFVGTALCCVAGAGTAVEESINTQLAETGEVNDWKVFGQSVLGSIEGYGFGKAAKGLSQGVKAIKSGGVKETLGAFNKQAIKTTLKNSGKTIAKNTAISTLKDKDTYIETATVLADDVVNGIETGEWNITSMICEVATVYGENYVGNLVGGIASDSVKKIDRITELYEEGQDMARNDYNVGFKSYREHAEKHVYYVADYMQDISKNVDGINTDETLFAALSHDLGMKGGYVKHNDNYIKADELLDIIKKDGKNVSFGDIADYVRKPHPLNSALTVLTDDIVPDGVDKDVVALLAMSHSKSTSGITYFDNQNQWKNCIDELDNALKQYNIDNNTSFTLDTQKLKDMIDNPDEFVRLQKEALIIRDGDAMSKVATIDGNTIMQTGNVSEIVNHSPRTSFNEPILDEATELAGLSDNLKTIDGEIVPDGDVSSGVKFHVGELNTKFSSKTDGISYYSASVELVEPNQTPHSTMFAIKERIGEVKTYSNCSTREFTINLPKEAEGTALGEWYKNEVDKLSTDLVADLGKQLRDKKIDNITYNKQLDFYKNINVEFK